MGGGLKDGRFRVGQPMGGRWRRLQRLLELWVVAVDGGVNIGRVRMGVTGGGWRKRPEAARAVGGGGWRQRVSLSV